jgi:hypothetical protein
VIKTTADALELLRRHDAAKLYETLDAWQQRELLCVVRRIAGEIGYISRSLPPQAETR